MTETLYVNQPAGIDPVTGKYVTVTAPAPCIDLCSGHYNYIGPDANVGPLPVDYQMMQINSRMQADNHAKAVTADQERMPVPTIKQPQNSLWSTNAHGAASVVFYNKSGKTFVRVKPNPNDHLTVIDRPATQADIERWLFEYKQYQGA